MKNITRQQLLLGISFTFWLISLALPALTASRQDSSFFGWTILMTGWLGFAGIEDNVNLIAVLAWWANPLYLLAMAKFALGNSMPVKSSYSAAGIGILTFLLSSYAVNAVPSFTSVICYGPGVLLWLLALLGPAYVVAWECGHKYFRVIPAFAALLISAYFIQIGWRAMASNESELDRLPFYSAKRGFICATKAIALPIVERQPAIVLEALDSQQWLEWLSKSGVKAIQWESHEYKRAPKGSPESSEAPYMILGPILKPARYKLIIEGGYPFFNMSNGGQFVHMRIIDSLDGKEIGKLVHKQGFLKKQGFCPSLTSYDIQKQEAIKWLSPFISEM